MFGNLQVSFSNQVEQLFEQLKKILYNTSSPFAKRMIVVPSPAMKSWLMLRMAKDPELGISAGLEISYIDQSIERLIALLDSTEKQNISPISLALVIENEIRQIITTFQRLPKSEKNHWLPLLTYLKVQKTNSRQTDKRLTALSEKLAALFIQYGKYAENMTAEWENTPNSGWQQSLWNALFNNKKEWKNPASRLSSIINDPNKHLPRNDIHVHVFAMSYVSPQQHRFFERIAKETSVNYYVLSPCQAFWSDLLSDRESYRLKKYWQQRDASQPQQLALEEFLRDNNSLLANFGRLGREMAQQIEDSNSITSEHYVVPEAAQELDSYQDLVHDDLLLQPSNGNISMLEMLQTDMTLLRNPNNTPKIEISNSDNSVQIHAASSPMREVQILYNAILSIIEKHAQDETPITPGDIIVMAPDISLYAPFIRTVFGSSESVLSVQIMDLDLPTQSPYIQAYLHLLSLSLGRWDASSLLQLFDYPAFQKKHQIRHEDLHDIREWIKTSGVRWGEDALHRNELLERDHCSHGMVENSTIGTWENAANTLITNIASNVNPLDIEATDGPLLGKMLGLIRSLSKDLKCLNDGTKLSLKNWAQYLRCLNEAYLFCDEDESDLGSALATFFDTIQQTDSYAEGNTFPFSSIHHHLQASLNKPQASYRETALNSVRFCSLLPMRAIPAEVVMILGMHEGAYPRQDSVGSLNQMHGAKDVDYCPSQIDYDRFLFLETLLSARRYFLMSYVCFGSDEGKEQSPSLLITELLVYLEKSCKLENVSVEKHCVRKHPFHAFDKSYFAPDCSTPSYSSRHYQAALAYYNSSKNPPTSFFPTFTVCLQDPLTQKSNTIRLNLKELINFARNPLKSYFNKTLGIYLDNEEKRTIKNDEDLHLSHLQNAILKRNAFKIPLEEILRIADRQGQLPLGAFKDVAIEKLKEDITALKTNLKDLGVDITNIHEITFSDQCKVPVQAENGHWHLPSLQLSVGDQQVTLVGHLPDVTKQGIIANIHGDKTDIIKAWPQFLVLHCLINAHNLPIEPKLISSKGKKVKTKTPFFDCPKLQLSNFIDYYFRTANHASPLIPEWIPHFLNNDASQLASNMQSSLEDDFNPIYNDYLHWAIKDGALPSADALISNWQPQAKQLFTELYENWCKKEK